MFKSDDSLTLVAAVVTVMKVYTSIVMEANVSAMYRTEELMSLLSMLVDADQSALKVTMKTSMDC